jgi:hypothetical protein
MLRVVVLETDWKESFNGDELTEAANWVREGDPDHLVFFRNIQQDTVDSHLLWISNWSAGQDVVNKIFEEYDLYTTDERWEAKDFIDLGKQLKEHLIRETENVKS